MNQQILDALVQTVREAIDKKAVELRELIAQDVAAEQRRSMIHLIKSSAKSEAFDLGKALFASLEDQIKNLPKPEPGKDGQDGKDADPEVIKSFVQEAVQSVQVPESLVDSVVAKRLAENPPASGKDGDKGEDGKDADPEVIKSMVSEAVKDFQLPEEWAIEQITAILKANPPAPGKEGEKGRAPTAEEISAAVTEWMTSNLVQPKDGKDGDHGKDAAEIDVLPEIEEAKSYPRGTWASYRGGLIKSTRMTHPIEAGKSLQESGWDIIVQGIRSIEVHPLDEGEFAVKTILTGGSDHLTKFAVPVMVYKGIWKEGEAYRKGHTATYSGSLWHCEKDAPTTKPGTSEEWKLCAKRGQDGKDLNVVKTRPETYKV